MAALATALIAVTAAQAQQQSNVTRNTYGELGILDMPNAHMADDGQIAITLGDIDKTQRYSIAFQFLPWLDASFRYSHVSDWLNQSNYYDRSFGLKMRLLQESGNLPDVSLGLRDILGTRRL